MTGRRCVTHALVLAVLAVGCARQPATVQTAAPAPTGASSMRTPGGPVPASTAPQPTGRASTPPAAATPTRPVPSEFVALSDVADIHFDFDKWEVRTEDARVLDANAGWLRTNANHLLLIEGHADERGTNEYNLALAERRAKAAMNYLVSRGIASNRITLVSYGEERPACPQHDERCWGRNRRAHFLVKPR
jgi:peptidoglycan-associated lipoprotein